MAKSYSEDLRERVIEAVEADATRHAAAAQFRISVSSAIRWVQRWRASGEITEPASRSFSGSPSPVQHPAAGAHVLKLQRDEIAAAQLAVDREVEQSEVALSTLKLKSDPD